MRDPPKKLGTIGLAVLTFIGYKQTDKPNLYIDKSQLELSKPGILRSTALGCKDIGTKKSEFVAKTQFSKSTSKIFFDIKKYLVHRAHSCCPYVQAR